MLAMLKAHAVRHDQPPLLWIHQTRDGSSHAFSGETRSLIDEHGMSARIFYSRPGADDRRGDHFDEVGRLDADQLKALISTPYVTSPFGREIELPGVYSDIYICGPPAFETMVRGALEELGINPSQICRRASRPPSLTSPLQLNWLLFRSMGSEVEAEWTAKENMTLLALAELKGVAPSQRLQNGLLRRLRGDLSVRPSGV